MSPVSADVQVLHCPSCGADVALGEGDEARCSHCGAMVPLPAEHRELRRIEREDSASRQRARAAFVRLDSPPWLVTRVLAAVFDQSAMAFWLFFGVPVGLFSVFVGLWFEVRFHTSSLATVGIWFGALFAMTFLPRSLGVYANRRACGRALLLAGLAARPPRLPGGPAGCHQCGAPLDVPEGALVIRCVYCRADSAVRIRTPFLKSAKRAARRVAHSVEEAVAMDATERAATRRVFLGELVRYVAWVGAFGGLFAVYQWDFDRVQARDDGSAPALGIACLVAEAVLLIVLMIRSLTRGDERAKEEERQRREGQGLPAWVRIVGPFGVWGFLLLLRVVFF